MTRYLVTDPCYVLPDEIYRDYLKETDGEVEDYNKYTAPGIGTILLGDYCQELDIKVGKRSDGVDKEMMSDSGLMCVIELEDGFIPTDYNGTAVTKRLDVATKWFNKFIDASRW